MTWAEQKIRDRAGESGYMKPVFSQDDVQLLLNEIDRFRDGLLRIRGHVEDHLEDRVGRKSWEAVLRVINEVEGR